MHTRLNKVVARANRDRLVRNAREKKWRNNNAEHIETKRTFLSDIPSCAVTTAARSNHSNVRRRFHSILSSAPTSTLFNHRTVGGSRVSASFFAIHGDDDDENDSGLSPLLQQQRQFCRRIHTTSANSSLKPTSSRSLSSPATAAAAENNDESLDNEIDMFTSSCFTKLLPDEIFYNDEDYGGEADLSSNRNRKSTIDSSLDLELGNESVWDDDLDMGMDENDDLVIEEVQEQQNSNRTIISEIASSLPSPNATGPTMRQKSKTKKTAIEMLRHFNAQEPPDADASIEELQLWLECAAQREAVLKYQKLVDKARDRNSFDSMGLMQRYLVQWYQNMRDTIDSRQQAFLQGDDSRRGKWRYGPFLCSLGPEKMAVILSQEALSVALLSQGKNGRDGVSLTSMSCAIGAAIETEVVFQRRMKEKFINFNDRNNNEEEEDDNDGNDANDATKKDSKLDNNELSSSRPEIDNWKFTATHLKMYMEDLNRFDSSGSSSNRTTIRRAKQAMSDEEAWKGQDKAHIGAALLAIFIENATIEVDGKEEPVFRVEKRWKRGTRSTSYVVLNESLYSLFLEDEFVPLAARTTRHTPMVVPPNPWVGPNEGGYKWLQCELMRTHGSKMQQDCLQHADLSTLFEGLNILGKTPWKINKKILEVAQHCWDNDIPIGDIPSRRDFELPPEPKKPEKITAEAFANKESPEYLASREALSAYKDKMYKLLRMNQKNMDLRSLRSSAVLKLDQAAKFQDFEKIYFPYNLDFRGRAYPVPPHLSNVGSDLCRGMLMFAEEKPLGKKGFYWLKVHLANFAGMDKMSFDDRAKFVDNNIENIRNSVNDPFSDDPWWMTLDDPFQGLATCHEICNAIDSGNPETYMSSLPVHMDGSCNGLQHYAALGLDTVGGKAVNLLEGEMPEDVYIGVMHEVVRRVAEEAARDVDFDVSNPDELRTDQKKMLKNNRAAKLVNGMIDRGVVKRTVMTSVYGVTYIGARQQIQEKIEEKLKEKGYDLDEMEREIFAAAGYLATMTIDVMGDLFQGARQTQNWLAECAGLISKQGHPVAWISPIGVPAMQPYRQRRPRTVVTVMQSVTLADDNDDLPVHRKRQTSAFPPNYVHSLDSSHMLLTAIEMDRRGLSFSAVHDSFWTHACDIDEMNASLRNCFVDLYSRPLLPDLKKSWEIRYPEVDFPELPELGDLNLEEVKSATYFFQ